MDSDSESVNANELPSNTLNVKPLCFYGVKGYQGRINDALFKPSIPVDPEHNTPQKTLVFFGGDIQNFIHLMDQNDSKIKYQTWCLEAAAIRLGRDFPNHHIIVIKPARITFEHISCFDNFVDGNFLGAPTHIYRYLGLPHLETLMKTMSKSIKKMPSEKLCEMLLKQQDEEDYLCDDDQKEGGVWQYESMSIESRNFLTRWQKTLSLHNYPLTLVAFSKGCVVLNQFLYEFHYAKRLEPKKQDSSFIDRIEAMYYLDAGHPGTKHVYVNSRCLLRTLADLRIAVRVFSSRYQLDDRERPHIRAQWLVFVKTLKEFNANLSMVHHPGGAADIDAHFDILLGFMHFQYASKPLPEPPPPPPLPPPPPASPAAAAPPPQSHAERNPLLDEVLGISLIKPSWSTHFGTHTILRRPLNVIMQRIMASGRARSGTESENANSEDDMGTSEYAGGDNTSDRETTAATVRSISQNVDDNMNQVAFDLEDEAQNMAQVVQDIENVTQNMARVAQNIEHAIQNTPAAYDDLAQHINQVTQNVQNVAQNIRPFAQNIAQSALSSFEDPVMDSIFAVNNPSDRQAAGTWHSANVTQVPGASLNSYFSRVDDVLQVPSTPQSANYSQSNGILQAAGTSQSTNVFSQASGTSQNTYLSRFDDVLQAPGTLQQTNIFSQAPSTSQNANFSRADDVLQLPGILQQANIFSQAPSTSQNANFSRADDVLQGPGTFQQAIIFSQAPGTSQNAYLSQVEDVLHAPSTSQQADAFSQAPRTSQNAYLLQVEDVFQAPGTSQQADAFSQAPSTSQNAYLSQVEDVFQAPGTSQQADAFSQAPSTSQNAYLSQVEDVLHAPGTSQQADAFSQAPSTSQNAYLSQVEDVFQAPGTSQQAPGASRNANFSQTNLQAPETSQPGPSQVHSKFSRSSQTPQLCNYDFNVCLSVKNNRFDFESDTEALEIFEQAKYFKTDYPVIAIPHDRDERPGIDIFMPEERIHKARVSNSHPVTPLMAQFMELVAALRASSVPIVIPPPVPIPVAAPLPGTASPNITLSNHQGVRFARTADLNHVTIEPTVSRPHDIPRNSFARTLRDRPISSPSTSRAANIATLHVNIAINDSNRAETVSDSALAPNSQGSDSSDSSPEVMIHDPLQFPAGDQIASDEAVAGTSDEAGTIRAPRNLGERNSARASPNRYDFSPTM